ncbi:MAG TPA: amino acid adenylation domain-containing protein [Myxococcaceae bacterium]
MRTFAELDERARAIAVGLLEKGAPGDRALLLYPPGMAYVEAFFGAIYAGMIPVPAYPPDLMRLGRTLPRLEAVVADARAGLVLTSAAISDLAALPVSESSALLGSLTWVSTDELPTGPAAAWRAPAADGDSLCFLQYTSGSTGTPRGVRLTHRNLLSNSGLIYRAFAHSAESCAVNWLPPYHDMGLIGGILQPLYGGFRGVLLSPLTFLARPMRWLEAISSFRGTSCGGPNFAYDLCVRKTTPEERARLDLSGWKVAFSGAEPIRPETLERFERAFSPAGFKRSAFYACYGLAEATLIVSGSTPGSGPVLATIDGEAYGQGRAAPAQPGRKAITVVGCGRPITPLDVRVVEPEQRRECAPGQVGEVWVAGPSVAPGYWNDAEGTRAAFGAEIAGEGQRYLRTGDLGFLRDGELFIAGRIKDLIIIRGRNHTPQDVERTVELSHPALRPGCGAAFAVDAESEERLVVVHELDARQQPDPDQVIRAVTDAVVQAHELQPHAVVLIRAGTIPKTSSGKIQRRATRAAFLEGTLEVVAQARAAAAPQPPAAVQRPAPGTLEAALAELLAERLRVSPEGIGLDTAISSLGVDSLSAVELQADVERRLGAVLPMTAFLEGGLVAGLAERIRRAPRAAKTAERALEGGYDHAPSEGQQGLWFQQQLAPSSTAYHVNAAVRLLGKVDVPALRRAFQALVDRHEALRTTFPSVDGKPLARVAARAEVSFRELEGGLDEAGLSAQLEALGSEPYDLARGPLMRVALLGAGMGPVLFVGFHHLITDFWSLGLLARELGALYGTFERGATPAAAPPARAYADAIRERAGGREDAEALQYWQQVLEGELPILDLPPDRPRATSRSFRAIAVPLRVDAERTRQLRALATGGETTLYTVLLAAFGLLLHRWSGQSDVLVGSPVAGRLRAADEEVAGYFVNLVVLRSRLSGDPGFRELLTRARAQVLGALTHQHVPFQRLVERFATAREAGRAPLFQASFTLQKATSFQAQGLVPLALGLAGHRVELGPLALESLRLERPALEEAVALELGEVPGGLVGSLQLSADMFDDATAAAAAAAFERLLAGICASPDEAVSRLPLHPDPAMPAERVEPAPPRPGSVLSMFEARVGEAPSAIAVVSEAGVMTYAALDARARAIAGALRRRGLPPEANVAVLLPRSADAIAAFLGAWRAGAAYVPLDPSAPPERTRFILEDARCAAVICSAATAGGLPETGVPQLRVEDLPAAPAESAAEAPAGGVAYVLYTSGSTGRPKGVVIEHGALRHFVEAAAERYGISAADRVLQLASLSFDASAEEIYPCLTRGGTLVLRAEGMLDSLQVFAERCAAGAITVLDLPTAFWHGLVPALATGVVRLPPQVRLVIIGGEQARADRLEQWLKLGLPIALLNTYGPTEATVAATAWEAAAPIGAGVPIGRPFPGTIARVLDPHLRPVPPGFPGELCLGGPQLARGYLGRPDLTAARFVCDPWTPAGRLYRTGDRARVLPDGNLLFLGRLDRQVKVRGFRIEPGEVEAALSALEGVADAAVTAARTADHGAILAAYVAAKPGAALDVSALRSALAATLPPYMVPSAFVVLPELPLSPSGKVDHRALPPVDAAALRERFVAPRTPAERELAGIWSELLGIPQVGAEDDFFALGGHSLIATQVMSRLRERLGVQLPLRAIFDSPRLDALARQVEAQAAGACSPLQRVAREGDLPLSFAQQRLWFLQQLDPGGTHYTMSGAFRLLGPLAVAHLEWALSEVVRRHEALRATFHSAGGSPVQRLEGFTALELPLVDLGALPAADRAGEVERLAREDALRPFDLSRGPLLRAQLLRLSAREHVLLVSMHHIVSDGGSTEVLWRELAALYRARAEGRGSPLEPLVIQYADFAAWERGRWQGAGLEASLAYWVGALGGAPATLSLPLDRPRPAAQSFRGAHLPFAIPGELRARLEALGRERGATLFMTLLAAFQAFLGRLAGQDDVVVGTQVANRNRPELEPLIGIFANALALRARLDEAGTFQELLAQVRRRVLEGFAHQELPFDRVVEALRPERSLSHAPIFQAMLVLLPESPAPELAGVTVSPLPVEGGTTKFDLSLSLEHRGGAVEGSWEYATDLFDAATIEQLSRHFAGFLEAVSRAPEMPLGRVPLMGPADRDRVLREWNATARPLPSDPCVHRLFEQQVQRTPGATALIFEGRSLTYEALNARANQLARRLRALGAGPESLIAVSMERSLELVEALYAVLKAGAAYVPFDPGLPPDRLRFMAKDAGVRILLTQAGAAARVPPLPGVTVVAMDAEREALSVLDGGDLPPAADPSNLVYALYTSGSTGAPKLAMNEHRPVANRLLWMQREYPLWPGDVVVQKTPYSFDVSAWEFFGPLIAGATLVVARPEGHKDPAYLRELIDAHGVTIIHFVPSMLRAFLEDARGGTHPTLRRVMCSGEALALDLQDKLLSLYGVELLNLYGPTEAAIEVTGWRCRRDPARASVPIGRPIDNNAIYVIDREGQPVPPGVAGELCIGGVAVGRGYFGRPGLTADRFRPDPFSGTPGARMYRSGDLARFLRDGTIEHLGRTDHQVKLRGFRIELGEIEAILGEHPQLEAAAVLLREDFPGDPYLCAYVVPRGGPLDPGLLRDALREKLPEHMVPRAFVALASMPLSANGKLDRRALPAPERPAREREVIPPADEVEERLVALWAALLRVDVVSTDDDFFELGGHSLLATQLMARVREDFGVELALRTLFESPRLQHLAGAIRRARTRPAADRRLVRAVRSGDFPAPAAQRRLWLMAQLDPQGGAYNIAGAFRVMGLLSVPVLERALAEVIRRHEALRATFRGTGQDVRVRILEPWEARIPVIAAADAEVERLAIAEAQAPFDLEGGPLVRARLLAQGPERHVLLFTLHHLVADGWTTEVLFKEVSSLYAAYASGRASPLPELPFSYFDVMAAEEAELEGGGLQQELGFWRERLSGAPTLELQADHPRPAAQTFRGALVPFELPAPAVQALRELSRREGTTLFTALLACFQVLLGRSAGQDDVVVGTPVSQRGRLASEALAGMFMNMLALRTDLSGAPTFIELLRRVKQTAASALMNQRVPFQRVVEEIKPPRDPSRAPIFQAVLALQPEWARAPLGDATVEPLEIDPGTAQYDLVLSVRDGGRQVKGFLEYNADLFERATVLAMLDRYRHLLEHAAARPETRIGRLEWMTPAERGHLLTAWNLTRASRGDLPVHRMFEAQVARTPQAIAVVHGEARLSYAELNLQANRVARALRARGAGPESRVAVYLERSTELVVALLGVLKAGAAYVPLDPSFPSERLMHMARTASAGVVLTREAREQAGDIGGAEVAVAEAARSALPGDELDGEVPPDALAYVLFTSGSTGVPKGAMITHRGLANHMRWMQHRFPLAPGDVVLQRTPISFDASVWELFAPLVAGATLAMGGPNAHRDTREIVEQVRRHGVTTLQLTPTLGRMLAQEPGLDGCTSLKRVFFGGEPLGRELCAQLTARLPVEVGNLYGPTETTIQVSFAMYSRRDGGGRVPIGAPVDNARLYVLDPGLEPVPLHVPGELYIGGECVGRGYVSAPGLTAARFIPDPFSPEPGARLYRTGDVVRRLADGSLEYLRRADRQVKLRGARMELEEIEAVLAAAPGVRQVAVVVRALPVRGEALVAYFVPRGEDVSPSELRQVAARRLPPQMVPSLYVRVDALPRTPGGKLDRAALPAPPLDDGVRPDAEPRGEDEVRLARIFAQVLGVNGVGREDDFFQLGGHSLLAAQVVSRVRETLHRELTLPALFSSPTVAQLATVLRALPVTGDPGQGDEPVAPVARLPAAADVDRMDEAELDALLGELDEGEDLL